MKKLVSSAVVASVLALAFAADAKLAGRGSATFEGKLSVGGGITGTSNEVSVSDDGTTVSVAVGLSHLATANETRDKHVQEHLETEKNPAFKTATLKVARTKLKFEGGEGDADGELTIHGVTKPVKFHYKADKDGAAYRVKGNAHISVKEFGIVIPNYLGVTMKDDVEITVAFKAAEQ